MKEQIRYTKSTPDTQHSIEVDIFDCCLQGFYSTFRVLLRGGNIVLIELVKGGNIIDIEVQEYDMNSWRPGQIKAMIIQRITDYTNKHNQHIKEITNEQYKEFIYSVNPIIAKAIEEILK